MFLIRFNEGCLPSNPTNIATAAWFTFFSSLHESGEDTGNDLRMRVEEERRCAYVAITRTRKSLTLSFVSRDDETTMMLLPSRFLDEMRLFSESMSDDNQSKGIGRHINPLLHRSN